MAGDEQWFFLVGEEQQGPMTLGQIQELAHSGALTPETLVWREGMAEWLPAGSLENFVQWPQAAPAQPVLQTGALQTGVAAPAPNLVGGVAGVTPGGVGGAAQPMMPRRSNAALMSLILGIASIPLTFLCIGWLVAPVAIILAIVAFTRIPGPMGNVNGKGMAIGGLVTGIVSLLMFGGMILIAKNAPEPSAAASAISDAETSIMSGSGGVAKGNSPQAKLMAASYSTNIDAMQKVFFVREGDKPKLQISGGKFITYCQLNEDSAVFLVHVPELRKYKDGAKESMVELAWTVANVVCEEEGSPLEEGDALFVGVRGAMLYADIVEGKVGDENPTRSGLESDDLELYFAPPSEEGAAESVITD